MTQNQNENTTNDDEGKLFVGGLSWETSQEKLSEYFTQYGEVIDCAVMKNQETGRSRGFGFVTFKDPKCVSKVLSVSPHELDGRTIDPKVCSTKMAQKGKKTTSYPKVFLGGLSANCTETDIRSFFSRYGNVMEVVLMFDQEKKRTRGFGFLSFESEESVKQVCAEHYVKINGKQVECKHAEPRDKSNKPVASNQWGGQNMGWGPPPSGPMGPNGPMPGPMGGPPMGGGGYQGGWGQPGPYGPPQGGWGPPQGYGPGYQNWCGPGWGGPPPQYGQGYGYGPGYGPGGNYGNYNGPPPPGGPPGPGGPPPAGDGYGPGQAPSGGGPGGQPPTSQGPPGAGTYPQENSNYGPSRGGYGNTGGFGNTSGSYGPSGSYSNSGNYGGQGNFSGPADSNPPPASTRVGGSSQTGYHPYRR